MNNVNPKYILRDYMLQNAIKKAENNDYTDIQNLLQLISKPINIIIIIII